jgi:hypothetical protein
MITVTATTVWVVIAIWMAVIFYALMVSGITNDDND